MIIRRACTVDGCEQCRVGHGPDQTAVRRAADEEGAQSGVAGNSVADDPVGQRPTKYRNRGGVEADIADGSRTARLELIAGVLHPEWLQDRPVDMVLDRLPRDSLDDLSCEEIPDVRVRRSTSDCSPGRSVLPDNPVQQGRVLAITLGSDPTDRERVRQAGGVSQQLARGWVPMFGRRPVAGKVGADRCVEVQLAVDVQPYDGCRRGDLGHGEPRVLVVDGGLAVLRQVGVPDCPGVQKSFRSGDGK